MSAHDEFMAAHQHILTALSQQMKLRSGDRNWIENERLAATTAANEWALAHGPKTITTADVERVEQRAIGHVDYTHKLALYVAELLYPRTAAAVAGDQP